MDGDRVVVPEREEITKDHTLLLAGVCVRWNGNIIIGY